MKQNYLAKMLLAFLAVLVWLPALAQTGTITGTVMDTKQQPIIGAAVVVKGTTLGGASDVNGKFRIEGVKPGNVVVQASYLGYRSSTANVTVEAGRTSTASISLEEDVQMLEEAVVIGYGTTQTRDLTGSVTAIQSKTFQQGNFATPEQMLIGKTPGVRITTNGGAPGAGSTIRIRGGTSLNASNDPLIVLDGIPLEGTSIAGSPNGLAMINPEDIETFTVLKDASAAAIYGSRGANGVIIITTKKGKGGDRLRVEVSNGLSVKQIVKTVDMMSADELRALINEKGTPGMKTLIAQGTANTDWQNEIYQPGITNNLNVVFSGGVKNLPYRLSLERFDDQGMLRTGKMERTGAALNLNPVLLNNRLKVNASMRYNNLQNRFADQGAIGSAVTFDPTRPVRTDTGRYEGWFEWTLPNGNPVLLAPKNPVATLNQREDISSVNRFIGNVELDYDIRELPGLRAILNLGGDFSRANGTVVMDSLNAGVFNRRGVDNQYEQRKDSRLLDAYLNYKRDWALHSIDFTGGYSYQYWRTQSPAFPDINLRGDTISAAAPFPFDEDNALISFYARAIYKLLDKYLLTASLRADGSSRFNPNGRWGYFPSVAIAWRMMDEDYFRQFKKLSNLKLRVSWGVTGQQDGIANYAYIPNYFRGTPTAQYQFGNGFVPVLRPAPYDANLKWETTMSYNGGIDFGFFNNRLYGNVDVYYKKTSDLLAIIPVAAGTNFSNQVLTNVGAMSNRGVELNLAWVAIDNKTTNLEFGANMTYNINRIDKLSVIDDPSSPGILTGGIAGGIGNTIQIHSVGFTRNIFYTRTQEYDENGKPIEGKYTDYNGDGVINEKDLVRWKAGPDPTTLFGFYGNGRYKRWNSGFSIRAERGHYIYNNVRSTLGQFRNISGLGYINNVHRDYLNSQFANLQVLSDYYLENANYLRLDNVFIGYNVGQLSKFVNMRVTAMIQNVLVITKYSGIDPEISGGIDNNFYPRPRVYTVNMNFTF